MNAFDISFQIVTGFDFFFDIPNILNINMGPISMPKLEEKWHMVGSWSPTFSGARSRVSIP
jgi:hypothetical protein